MLQHLTHICGKLTSTKDFTKNNPNLLQPHHVQCYNTRQTSLSPRKAIITFQCNISQFCFACIWQPCCYMLNMLGVENGEIFHATFVDVARWCSRLAKFAHKFDFNAQHVATHPAGWRNVRKMLRPTLLRPVALKCCNRLAGALKNR